ncbi:hypothetical protein [Paenibacillus sp. KN14-4R]|uniref:hypothetical protein n=1 Tax=Paenibacillus sp. KN14-4R TaxID=3445773 RepID=UPI003FA17546
MNRVLRIVNMHVQEKMGWFYLPLIILFSSFAINLLVGVSMKNEEGFSSGGIASIFVYVLIIGVMVLAQTFPMAIGFSARRKDYFWGTSLMGFLVCLGFSLVVFLLAIIEGRWTEGWGVNLHFFNLPFISQLPLIQLFAVFFIIMLHQFFLGFVFSIIYKRVGRNGMFFFFIGLGLVLTLGVLLISSNHLWGNIYDFLIQNSVFDIALWLIPLLAIYMAVSYTLLRKATV